MNAIRYSVIVISILVITIQRLPAPVAEETPATTAAPEPAKTKSTRPKPGKSESDTSSKSTRRFDGVWEFAPNAGASFRLTISNGTSAEWRANVTNTLNPKSKGWPFLPAPYNASPSLSIRAIATSTELKMEGSNLRINWAPAKLIDWAPKTIPYNLMAKPPLLSTSAISYSYMLTGDKLIRMNPNGSAMVLSRVR